MKTKNSARIETYDFWYDLFEGGYIKPIEILENEKDIEKVEEAIQVLTDFRDSCDMAGIIEYM